MHTYRNAQMYCNVIACMRPVGSLKARNKRMARCHQHWPLRHCRAYAHAPWICDIWRRFWRRLADHEICQRVVAGRFLSSASWLSLVLPAVWKGSLASACDGDWLLLCWKASRSGKGFFLRARSRALLALSSWPSPASCLCFWLQERSRPSAREGTEKQERFEALLR